MLRKNEIPLMLDSLDELIYALETRDGLEYCPLCEAADEIKMGRNLCGLPCEFCPHVMFHGSYCGYLADPVSEIREFPHRFKDEVVQRLINQRKGWSARLREILEADDAETN